MTTKTLSIDTINIGLGVQSVDTTGTITNIEKRGRWHYISVDGVEFTEGNFFKNFTKSNSPEVAPVTEAEIEDAVAASDVDDVIVEFNSPVNIFSLSGFEKFRAIHKTQKLELNGAKVRTQNNGDDIAASLVQGAIEYGCIWEIPMVKNNLPVDELKARYANLNPGMVRMNVGNMLRAKFRAAARAAEVK